MKAVLAFLLLLFTTTAAAAPLDDALQIALDNSASIAAKYAELGIARSGHDWSSDVRFSYNLNNTDTTTTADSGDITRDSEGLNGRFTLNIPLFSNKTDGSVSKANAAAAVERERVIVSFLTSVKGLVLLHHQHITADESYQLKRDKLDYFKQSVSEGLTESPAELWSHAEAAKQAEHLASSKRLEYQTELEIVSRQYGGSNWQQLKAHLQAHVNLSKASLKL